MHHQRRPTLAHVPALDGLRGLAVLAVVAYHAGFAGAQGGYLGVSAFFTLSGFLITSLLLVEWSGCGGVSLRGFWARRFRRLLPAAVAVIAGVVVAATFLADSGQLADLRGDVVAGLGYVANWRFVLEERSYGELFTGPSPLQHLWSLAIEEQFYVAFPLLAVGLLRIGRGRRWVLGAAFVPMLVASVAWSVHLSGSVAGVARAYYDTGARAAELLAGVLLALAVAGRTERLAHHRRLVSGAGALALAGLLVAWAVVPQSSPALPGGGFAVHAAAVVLVLLAAHVPGAVSGLCAVAPLRLLGRVSYGVYLIHWPVFVWVDADGLGHDGVVLLATRVAITATLTAASFHLLEQPIRRRRAPIGRRGMAVGFASVVVVAVAAAGVGRWSNPDDDVLLALDTLRRADAVPTRPQSVSAASASETSGVTPASAPRSTPTSSTSPPAPVEAVDHVLLVGDSVMSQAYDRLQLRFAARGVATAYAGGPGTGPLFPQGSWAAQVQEWVAAQDPDVVVIEACCNYTLEPERRYVDAAGAAVAPSSPEALVAWEHEVRALVDRAGSRGAQVLLVRFAPVQTNGWYGALEDHVAAVNAMYERLVAERDDLGLVDWSGPLAPDGAFTPDLPGPDGTPVRVRLDDGVHLTPEGSDRVAGATVTEVLDAGRPARRR
ncbi:MAG: acyltransferase family protein [Acidimicrobiia bacterium]